VRKLLIIFILLIFSSVSLAGDSAWLLWQHWGDPTAYTTDTSKYPPRTVKVPGSWSLINALNSRSECLDALLEEHIRFYKRYEDDPTYEVLPKPKESELRCIQSFLFASESEPVSKACKELLTYFILRSFKPEGIKSELSLTRYASKEARQAYEKVMQMRKEGKTSGEIREFYKASGIETVIESRSKVQHWCLPVGVDPKTIGAE